MPQEQLSCGGGVCLRTAVTQPGMAYCVLQGPGKLSNCVPAETMIIGCLGISSDCSVWEQGLLRGEMSFCQRPNCTSPLTQRGRMDYSDTLDWWVSLHFLWEARGLLEDD